MFDFGKSSICSNRWCDMFKPDIFHKHVKHFPQLQCCLLLGKNYESTSLQALLLQVLPKLNSNNPCANSLNKTAYEQVLHSFIMFCSHYLHRKIKFPACHQNTVLSLFAMMSMHGHIIITTI